jgi:hypothetical protein
LAARSKRPSEVPLPSLNLVISPNLPVMTTSLSRRHLIAGAALAIAAAPARGNAPRRARVHDLMPDFWRVHDSVQGRPATERVEAIGRLFFRRHAEVYAALGFLGARNASQPNDPPIAPWLVELDKVAPQVRALSHQAPLAWAAREARFLATFPDQVAGAPVWLLPSLGQFNGFGRVWQRRPSLWFGIDGIVMLQGPDANLSVLFDHEAFHLYFMQVGPREPSSPLWYRIWGEGLAIFVSARLNANASRGDLLMSEALAATTAAELRQAAATLLPLLDARDRTTHDRFLAADVSDGLPARIGYLLGWQAIDAVAGGTPLPTLAKLRSPDARAMLTAGLERLARG